MTEIAKTYDPKKTEKKWYAFWENGGFFSADPLSNKPKYSIILPPPNVTGALHMGHGLVDTLQDILIRYKRMCGFETLWLPGTDHAGISTQAVVERHLYKTLGKKRKDFGREEFLHHVWTWKEQYQTQIIDQLKQLGCSCDWSRLRFTMDAQSNRAVKQTFQQMYDEGLIYRGNYLVNWDPITQTAIADEEVEYEEIDSFLWYFRYPMAHDSTQSITIATTRPETMLGDVAVAVSPHDPRYKDFVGKKLSLPLQNREIPIIADEYVDQNFGTGAVKITPAHDINDYEIGQRHNLEMLNIMNPDGTINQQGGIFTGLTMADARQAVINAMKNIGTFVRAEPHQMRIGISDRSKAIVQPYLSRQWFVKMAPFKEILMQTVAKKEVILIPEHWEKTYYHWIHNLRDWCISRQLWWGHRIPIWYDKEKPERCICYTGDDLPDEVRVNPDRYYQDPDVLDTWFSSALWPFSTLGWPESTPELSAFFPHNTLITGHDILFFWVARMILMAKYTQNQVPFRHAFIHGLIYGKSYWREDQEKTISYLPPEERLDYEKGKNPPPDVFSKWEKMSKSKGNIIDPLDIIDEYGTDALRFALCFSVTHARQIDLDRRRFEECKNFSNKIWNAARFVLSYVHPDPLQLRQDLLTLDDRWILSKLGRTIDRVNKSLDIYDFDDAAKTAYAFFWDEFCAYYLEMTKPYLFEKIGSSAVKQNKQLLLSGILLSIVRLLHPIAPFITEEIFSLLKETLPPPYEPRTLFEREIAATLSVKACIVAPYPQTIDKIFVCEEIEQQFSYLAELVYTIRNLRAEMSIPPSLATEIFITGENTKWIKDHAHILSALVRIETLHYTMPSNQLFCTQALVRELSVFLPLPNAFREKESLRLAKEIEKLQKQVQSIQIRINNQAFIDKAPRELVETTKTQLHDAETKLEHLSAKYQALTHR